MINNPQVFKIFTHTTEAERLLLFDLAQKLSDSAVVVEIGSYLGASTCFLAEGLLNSSANGHVYAVDTWTNAAMSEGERDTYSEFLNNIEPYKDIVTPLQGFSADISKTFHHKIDLLFVDGDHSYEGARNDLENWLPKVREGGYVVCHDYSWAKGVQRAVKEYLIPLQIEPGYKQDGIYWTKISRNKSRLNSHLKATIAIPTYKRKAYVLDALHSVIAQETDFAFEVLVLDNDCDRGLQTAVEEIAQNSPVSVRYLPIEPLGLHNGRNIGAIVARGEIVVYIDDDIIAPQGWLAALCKPFENANVGGVGGKSVPQWEGSPPDWLKTLDPCYFSLLDLGETQRAMRFPETPYGCNMAYRRDLVLSLDGFFPDGIGNRWIEWQRGDGETGFANKVFNQGFQIIYSPEAWLNHRISAQRQTIESARRRTIKGAISEAYSQSRSVQLSRFSLLKHLLQHVSHITTAGIKYILSSFQSLEKRLPRELSVLRFAILSLYSARALVDPTLRRWIGKSNYWPSESTFSQYDVITGRQNDT